MASLALYATNLQITTLNILVAHHCPWRKQHLFTPSMILFFNSSWYFLLHLAHLWRKCQAVYTLHVPMSAPTIHSGTYHDLISLNIGVAVEGKLWVGSFSSQQPSPSQQNCCSVISYQAERTKELHRQLMSDKLSGVGFISKLSCFTWLQSCREH